MKSLSEMTPTELRIACAEKCGWREVEVFVDYSLGLHKIDSFPFEEINEVPDYEHDMNAAMELMEKIWEKEPTADIGSNRLTVDGGYCVHCFSWRVDADTLPIAIMRAYLTVTEEK